MDDSSVFFFEKYLCTLYNNCPEFTKTHLLVVLDTFFKMMENGLYQIRKLKTLMHHMIQIQTGGFDQVGEKTKGGEEVIMEHFVKFWQRAPNSWLPINYNLEVCKWISDFLL